MERDDILAVARRYWGFSELRPLQEQAIRAALDRRDSLVVLPTGGGKSLCYQIPAEAARRTDIVVSPLIALMKDQVDGLRECGYPAAALYSGMPFAAVRAAEEALTAGQLRLIFVAPERLLTPRFLQLIERLPQPSFAIDEAHCISHWGHDFRPEYRQLADLKSRFRGASVHAYTATATERVRADIISQLHLENPQILVGTFDRPNLSYRVVQRTDTKQQVLDALQRHSGEAAIVYCLSRKDAESMTEFLTQRKLRSACYHAGMNAEERRRTQDAFASEEIDVVTATVAFGMGIDRSDVRTVIHATMPKSIEHYQQETGRAGRDGLEAECLLLYSAADVIRWESLIERSAAEAGAGAEVVKAAFGLLDQMRRFCSSLRCRHRALSEYFGQEYSSGDCGACDICLGEIEGMADSTVTAQKILSCVARTGERFGAEHVVDVLLGADTDRVRRWNHARLSTYGLMKGEDRKRLTNLLYQLVDIGLLSRTEGDRPVLQLNESSWQVLRGQRETLLLEPKTKVRQARFDETSWEGVDRGLYESLRALRRRLAEARGVPAYVLFSDATLRDMARIRPGSPSVLLRVHGVGERKLADLGEEFLALIKQECEARGLQMNVFSVGSSETVRARQRSVSPGAAKDIAFKMFAQNAGIDQVATATERAPSTVWTYLEEFVTQHSAHPLDAWVKPETVRAIAGARSELGKGSMKPVFERLGGAVSYDEIRITLARLRS